MTLKVQTHNDGNINVNGTCLQGYVHGPGQKLVEQFGEPLLGYPDDKVEYEWNLKVKGKPITIYAWKNYGEKSFDQLTLWHVGGKNKEVLDILRELGVNARGDHGLW